MTGVRDLAERRAAWAAERAELERLLELEEPARQARLDRVEDGDPALADRLCVLLRSEEAGRGLFARPLFEQPLFDRPPLATELASGFRLGPWQIEHEIGRGGVGVVYAGRRADGAFPMRVAIKVLHRHREASAFARAFELEREILARLRHPAIARILDGGSSSDGRSFLVMEYADGQTIDQWALDKGEEEITRVFLRLADALTHAHGQGVVHCDLKPAHILIDGEGEIRLVDFGIARVAGRDGVAACTPRFASPEQLCGEEPSTASDIFACGRILENLLGGCHRPGLEALARRALAPDPSIRPDAEDLRRGLEALIQAPRRRARRRIVASFAAVTVIALCFASFVGRGAWQDRRMAEQVEAFYASPTVLSAGSSGAGPNVEVLPAEPKARVRALLWASSERLADGRAGQARQLGLQALATAQAAESASGGLEASTWLEIGENLTEIGAYDGAELAFHRVLRGGPSSLGGPGVLRRLRAGLGTTARRRGDMQIAWARLAEMTSSPFEKPFGGRPELRAERWLAAFLLDIGRPAAAGLRFEQLLARVEESPWRGGLEHAALLIDTAQARAKVGDFTRARNLERKSRAILRHEAPPAHPEWARAMTLDASIHLLEGASTKAARAARDAVELHDQSRGKFADLALDAGGAWRIRCVAETQLRQLKRARSTCRRALERLQRERGPEHPSTATLRIDLSKIAALDGDFDAARSLTLEAQAILGALPVADNADNGLAINYLALTAAYRGLWQEANQQHREALEVLATAVGRETSVYAFEVYHFGLAQLRNDRPAEALPTLEEARERLERSLGAKHPRLAWTWKNLAQAYFLLHRDLEGSEALGRAWELVDDEDVSLIRQLESIRSSRLG